MNPVIYLRAPNELVIGKNHECEVYKLTPGQLRNLARDSVRLALDEARDHPQVGSAECD